MNNSEDKKSKSVVAGETTKIPIVNDAETNDMANKNASIKEENDNKDTLKQQDVEKNDKNIPNEEEKKSNENVDNIKCNNEMEKKQDKIVIKAEKSKKSSKYIIPIIAISVLLCLVITFGIIVCINKINDNIYKNVFLEEYDLSNYTVNNLEALIDEENKKFEKEILIDIYQDDKKMKTISSKEIEFKIDKKNTVNDVISFGRSGNIFVDNFNIIKTLFSKHVIQKKYEYNIDNLEEILKNVDIEIDGRFVEDTYNIDEKNSKIIIKRGISGNSLDYDYLRNNIINMIKSHENGEIVIKVEEKTPVQLTAQEIYDKVKREPQNASVDRTKSPVEIKNEIYGIDFNVEDLQTLLNKEESKEQGKEVEYKIKLIEPEVKLRDISADLCLEKIAGLTTYFDAGQYARANNLKVALSYLNDIIIMPGEVFSYNAVIGDTTAAKGYMAAAIFKGGRVVDEMGGGICQTSSTLYNVALLADLQIVERHAHGLPVGYVRPSLDATVYGDVLDFKFKNTRSYPLKIVTSFSNSGEMNISLYGTKEEVEYDIQLQSNYLYTVNYTTEYIQDPNMNEGEQAVLYNGVNGYASEAYFIKKLNGEVVETRYLSKDVYDAQIKTVKVGTRKNENQGQS